MGMLNVVKQSIEKGREKIKAYHGSPHDFDKFSTEHMGSGEGAQAYGRGLYFAQREGTAQSYKGSTNYIDKKRQFQRELPDDASIDEVMEMNAEGAFSPEMTELLNSLESDDFLGYDYPSQAISATFSKNISDYDPSPRLLKARDNGTMYEVDINASPDELLDYDLPISEQSDEVKKRILDLGLTDLDGNKYTIDKLDTLGFRGQNVYEKLSYGDDSRGSEALRNAGIKGIKYADAQTRFSSGGKTHNYVIFDDKLIDISRKYGIPPAMASAVLAGTMSPEQAQAQTESTARQDMTRRERRANPPSEVLRNYSVGQAGKAIGEMGLGVVQGLGEGLDFFNSANIQRSVMGLPQLTPAQDALSPITDIRLLEDGEGRDNARTIGSLFSPI